mmetsp:Transcript_24911/g.69453  ORF Transcript_24911/g.69453 Transcript_24911/m.69453 type:complete len:90 (-) Transcript_24911:87-356(-)|eukprot:CAMPEP_0117661668 /NCGR_PEP_ID=MMETSP0804-20121206/7657_1 /TAXON_ID=1074897 /ORGANISM="Tetraselmis astigmatica, Strain CCMP880" /LENGTH=89 /DNA_ID=CAMNT_0005468545 /DNA_START=192 /DNA_END=461 /DNA_ORIENTATION=+
MDFDKESLAKLIDFTENSAEKILVVSLLVVMVVYVLSLITTAMRQGIGITGQDSGIDPTSLPAVPEEVAEAVASEQEEEEEEGDTTKED